MPKTVEKLVYMHPRVTTYEEMSTLEKAQFLEGLALQLVHRAELEMKQVIRSAAAYEERIKELHAEAKRLRDEA